MTQDLVQVHRTDQYDNPDGGETVGLGLQIRWQQGSTVAWKVDPCDPGMGREVPIDPNGCFVQTVIEAAIGRLEYYQTTKFACEENAEAIIHLVDALTALYYRTARREGAGVAGTHGTTAEEGD